MRVLLIEDDAIWQLKIRVILEELEWELLKTIDSVDKIAESISETNPNLIISDIMLDDMPIFPVFKEIPNFKIPIVFITNYPSDSHYQSLKNFSKAVLLIKPFHALTLKSTVDLLPVNKSKKQPESGVWVRGKHNLKIWIEEGQIWWIHSNGNYCFVQTATTKYAIKGALIHLVGSLSDSFIQIHRAYLVNKKYIQKIELTRSQLFVSKYPLPISRKYKKEVVEYLRTK